jgi:Flp pilus assembly protein TadD
VKRFTDRKKMSIDGWLEHAGHAHIRIVQVARGGTETLAVELSPEGEQHRIGPCAPAEAMALLERAHRQHPTDRDLLMALVSIARDTRDFGTALRPARELVTLDPADTRLRWLVSDLEKRQADYQSVPLRMN